MASLHHQTAGHCEGVKFQHCLREVFSEIASGTRDCGKGIAESHTSTACRHQFGPGHALRQMLIRHGTAVSGLPSIMYAAAAGLVLARGFHSAHQTLKRAPAGSFIPHCGICSHSSTFHL